MIHTLKLGGETRQVLFGNLAFKKFSDESGLSLGNNGQAMTDQDITIIPVCLYYALRAAERYEKKTPGEYDADDVAMWMDAEGGVAAKVIPWILEAITDMTGEAVEEDTKKKVKQ